MSGQKKADGTRRPGGPARMRNDRRRQMFERQNRGRPLSAAQERALRRSEARDQADLRRAGLTR